MCSGPRPHCSTKNCSAAAGRSVLLFRMCPFLLAAATQAAVHTMRAQAAVHTMRARAWQAHQGLRHRLPRVISGCSSRLREPGVGRDGACARQKVAHLPFCLGKQGDEAIAHTHRGHHDLGQRGRRAFGPWPHRGVRTDANHRTAAPLLAAHHPQALTWRVWVRQAFAGLAGGRLLAAVQPAERWGLANP